MDQHAGRSANTPKNSLFDRRDVDILMSKLTFAKRDLTMEIRRIATAGEF